MKKTLIFFLLFSMAIIVSSCTTERNEKNANDSENLSGKIYVFHAGSLSVPMKEIVGAFNKIYPGITVLLEPAGSVECARKITELHRNCDVFVSADYKVITQMLMPDYTEWYIPFSTNEIVIAFTQNSRKAGEISAQNWYQLLLSGDINFGRSDPNSDPCGYRSVFTIKLAEKYYQQNGFASKMLNKDIRIIRPKEVDLLALLESGAIDYIFIYRSVAVQHNLKFITLPDEINLKSLDYASLYNTVSCEINGKKPGEKIMQKGEPIIYGITIPKNAPNRDAALAFVSFILDKTKGGKIFSDNGQPLISPVKNNTFEKIPVSLKSFAIKDDSK